MILEIGHHGIAFMFNTHTKTNREMQIITKETTLKGPITLEGNAVHLGYNETVLCDNPAAAKDLFKKIAAEVA
jgi:hypothetical protein